jgi:sodium-dependent dicarboxylate transporter 2/3/5
MIAAARAEMARPSRAEWTVGIIMGLTALAWVTRPLLGRVIPGLSDTGIAIAGALLVFLVPIDTGRWRPVLSWDEAERIPWGVLILFGGGLSLAAAVETTGLAAWIGQSLNPLQSLPLVVITAVVTAVVLLLTELTSNTATAAAFLPIVGAIAVGMQVDPLLLTIPVALAASCAFMMPVATPPNAIVFGGGRVTIPQMARAGVWVNLIADRHQRPRPGARGRVLSRPARDAIPVRGTEHGVLRLRRRAADAGGRDGAGV